MAMLADSLATPQGLPVVTVRLKQFRSLLLINVPLSVGLAMRLPPLAGPLEPPLVIMLHPIIEDGCRDDEELKVASFLCQVHENGEVRGRGQAPEDRPIWLRDPLPNTEVGGLRLDSDAHRSPAPCSENVEATRIPWRQRGDHPTLQELGRDVELASVSDEGAKSGP
jgi:hypothetical protein